MTHIKRVKGQYDKIPEAELDKFFSELSIEEKLRFYLSKVGSPAKEKDYGSPEKYYSRKKKYLAALPEYLIHEYGTGLIIEVELKYKDDYEIVWAVFISHKFEGDSTPVLLNVHGVHYRLKDLSQMDQTKRMEYRFDKNSRWFTTEIYGDDLPLSFRPFTEYGFNVREVM